MRCPYPSHRPGYGERRTGVFLFLGRGELALDKGKLNMLADGTQVAEPISFVVSESSGLAAALGRYAANLDAPYGDAFIGPASR